MSETKQIASAVAAAVRRDFQTSKHKADAAAKAIAAIREELSDAMLQFDQETARLVELMAFMDEHGIQPPKLTESP